MPGALCQKVFSFEHYADDKEKWQDFFKHDKFACHFNVHVKFCD